MSKLKKENALSDEQLEDMLQNPEDGGYPEECCDPAEISDDEFSRYESGRREGFWNAFIGNKADKE